MQRIKLVIASLLLIAPFAANAVPISLDFTATGFETGAPTDPVSGTIVYEAASLGATIDSLTSISLTIDGYSYTLGEIGFISPFGGPFDIVGGVLNGVSGIGNSTNDFWIRFNRVAGTGFDVAYSSAGDSIYTSQNFTDFSLSAASVPEPGTLALLGIGLLGMGAARRKKA